MLTLFHVTTGIAVLILGAIALLAPKRRRGRHGRLGEIYFWLLLLTLASALVVGARDPAISLFEIVTPPTLGFGVLGYVAAKRRRRWLGAPWISWHIAGQGGSYIGVVTASAFQVIPRLVEPTPFLQVCIGVLPTVVGTFLLVRTQMRWIPATSRWNLARSTRRTPPGAEPTPTTQS